MGVYAETSGASISCINKKTALTVASILKAQAKKSDKYRNVFAQEVYVDTNIVYFCASSGRIQNLEWQMEQIWGAIRKIKGVEELSAPFLVEGDGVYFTNDK